MLIARSAVEKVKERGRTKQVTSRSAAVAGAFEAALKDLREKPQVACHNSHMNPSWAAPEGKACSNSFSKGATGNSSWAKVQDPPRWPNLQAMCVKFQVLRSCKSRCPMSHRTKTQMSDENEVAISSRFRSLHIQE
jgi:hypothetical protein